MSRPHQNVRRLRAKGTDKPCRHEDREELPASVPAPPGWLTPNQAQWFNDMVRELLPLKVLTRADCLVLAQVSILADELQEDPRGFSVGKHGTLRQLMKEVGLTPLSRNSVGAPLEREVNEFEMFD